MNIILSKRNHGNPEPNVSIDCMFVHAIVSGTLCGCLRVRAWVHQWRVRACVRLCNRVWLLECKSAQAGRAGALGGACMLTGAGVNAT